MRALQLSQLVAGGEAHRLSVRRAIEMARPVDVASQRAGKGGKVVGDAIHEITGTLDVRGWKFLGNRSRVGTRR